jgi:glycosyltransferase involved in cell wall biosynthesis
MSAPVTVLIATFNRARFVVQAVESVLRQSVPPSQVIVVDDGSTDHTADLLKPYLSRVEYVRKENGGKATALNLGLPRVRQEYLWIFDDDDVALPSALESHLATFDRRPAAHFTYSSYFEGKERPDGTICIQDRISMPEAGDDGLFVKLLLECSALQQGMLVRRACYAEVGPFDEKMLRCQDYEMILRLAHRFSGVRNGEFTFIFREHRGPRGTAAQPFAYAQRSDRTAEFNREIARRYWERLALHEYLGKSRGPRPELTSFENRRALLTRAAVVARRGLWGLALEDVRTVVGQVGADGPLSLEERQTLYRMTRITERKAFEPLLEDARVRRELKSALRRTPLGRQIRRAMLPGLRREVRLAIRRFDVKLAVAVVRAGFELLGSDGVRELALSR